MKILFIAFNHNNNNISEIFFIDWFFRGHITDTIWCSLSLVCVKWGYPKIRWLLKYYPKERKNAYSNNNCCRMSRGRKGKTNIYWHIKANNLSIPSPKYRKTVHAFNGGVWLWHIRKKSTLFHVPQKGEKSHFKSVLCTSIS